ncbi:hypothetical protein [Cohnella rhizosphaerae]|uniref:Uncharacterized protein n=1 Tax=Cohnella rhizosphaerae TaxID=1457232 RepID=A0A9X4KVU0_9BACL|nr:hypothetical protein [Cohnella rhizosphaerae]MDG0811246.1 hypothetical protein [Cohnella rhizosphaerae]
MLLQASSSFSAAADLDIAAQTLKATVIVNAATTVSLHAVSATQVKLDGTILSGGSYTYNAATKVLSLSLTAGSHAIEAQ